MSDAFHSNLKTWLRERFEARDFAALVQWSDQHAWRSLDPDSQLRLANAAIALDDRELAAEVLLHLNSTLPHHASIQAHANKLQFERGLRRRLDNRLLESLDDLGQLANAPNAVAISKLEHILLQLQLDGDWPHARERIQALVQVAPADATVQAWAKLADLHLPDNRVALVDALLDHDQILAASRLLSDETASWSDAELAPSLKTFANQGGDARALALPFLLKPLHERLTSNLVSALAIPLVYQSKDHLLGCRDRYTRALDQLIYDCRPERLNPNEIEPERLRWSNFFLAYQGEDDRALQQRFADWQSRCMQRLIQCPAPVTRQNKMRLRIAMVSSFWRECTVGSYFSSWIETLHQAGHEIHVVQIGPLFDAHTDALASHCQSLHRIDGSTHELVDAIRAIDADVIIYPEIGMDARVMQLASMRLAAKQFCAWGHPITTGYDSIDGYFTCALMEPPDAKSHYHETLMPLPGIGTRYHMPQRPSIVDRKSLGLPDGFLVLIPQSPFKIHPDCDAHFAEVAAIDPRIKLVLFQFGMDANMRVLRGRMYQALKRAGANPDRQLVYLPTCDRARFLQINAACDVMLDTLHWSGGNTAIDALMTSLPVLTVPGRFMRGRQSMTMLQLFGHPELIYADTVGVVSSIQRLLQSPDALVSLRSDLLRKVPDGLNSAAALKSLNDYINVQCGQS